MTRFFGRENKMMVLGTAGITDDGELFLSKLAEQRAHRVAEVYYNQSFNRANGQILVAGGYSKELKDAPPVQREAQLLGRYLIEQYSIPERALLIEDESTTTEENFTLSLERYPEFFDDVMNDRRKLGLVSHPFHLKRAAKIGSKILSCSESSFRGLPTWQPDNKENEAAAMRVMERRYEEVRLAADS